jgi:cytosine deaminase
VIDLLVRDVRVPDDQSGDLTEVDLQIDGGRIVSLAPAGEHPIEAREVVEGAGAWATPPYVEPHVHLDAALTAGQPRWNKSGTLWEGIACWAERKPMLTREDVIGRAEQTLRWYAANGTLHVRSHVDVTDPSLVALDALLEVRDRVRDVMTLQLVAFPQEGICSFPNGEHLLTEAARRGVDVIGAIPHFEDTREDGVRSV